MLIDKFTYTKHQNKGACAVNVNGIDIFHEECHCRSFQLVPCQTACDSDKNCKGYVISGVGCHMATNSTCQSECNKYHVGNVGDLIKDSRLNDLVDSYEGCFIKDPGNLKFDIIGGNFRIIELK